MHPSVGMRVFLVLIGLLNVHPVPAASVDRVSLDRTFSYLEENVGQAESNVRFVVRGVLPPTYLTNDALVVSSEYDSQASIRFAPAGSTPTVRSLESWPGILNRFEGDRTRWRRGIPAHRRIQYSDVHPNVDLIAGQSDGQPSLTFVIRAGGDPAVPFLEAADTISSIRPDGEWSVTSGIFGSWIFRKPRAWQEGVTGQTPVDVSFVLSTNRVRFQVGAYDRTRPLYVETSMRLYPLPQLSFQPGSLRVDAGANAYFAGGLPSPEVCRTGTGARREYCFDAFVAAIHPNGEPIFLSILAGRFQETASQLGFDPAGNLIVAGASTSSDFPVTPDAFQAANAGPVGPSGVTTFPLTGDVILARLDVRSGDLLYLTFFGQGGNEDARVLALGADGSATLLISGSELAATSGAWIESLGCRNCYAFGVVGFAPGLTRLRFSTLLPEQAVFYSLAVHSDLSVYLAGGAASGAPTTPQAMQREPSGEGDAYIVRLAADGSRPLFATYFGGSGGDFATAIAADASGEAWVYGSTASPELLGYKPSGPAPDFLMRLKADGSMLLRSLFAPWRSVSQFTVDTAGRLTITAGASSPVLDTTPNASLRAGCGQTSHDYVEVREPDGSLRFATYVPGLNGDSGFPVASAAAPAGVYRIGGRELQRVDFAAPSPFSLGCLTSAASRRNLASASPGQIVTLLGAGIGPVAAIAGQPNSSGQYPTALGGVRVLIGGIPAPLLYVQASQINAVVPYTLTPGAPVDAVIEYQSRTAKVTLDVVPARFSLFTADASGSGHAAALNQDGTLNSPSNPAARGSIVVLYGTGAGVTAPASVDGALAPFGPLSALPRPAGQIVAGDNGTWDVLYAGAAPGLINGLTQVNVRIPETSPPGTSVTPVAIRINGALPENPAWIAIR